ncbi:MAG: penicillin-binding protein 2 [Halieaceae bacterium]|jgi:penicillin-binding protein 2
MAAGVALKDTFLESRLYGGRSLAALVFVLLLAAILVGQYTSLQITQYEDYRTRSERNRVQLQPVPPKRGLIYDRNGVLLAENRPSFNLTIVRERVDDWDETLGLLREVVFVSDYDLEKFDSVSQRRRPYESVPLRFKLSEEEIARLAVNSYLLPGVEVEAQLLRHYNEPEVFAHVLGYVGRINEQEEQTLDEVNYSATHHVGKIGLEKHYEAALHGQVGYQNVETNAHGRVLRVLERTDPLPGADLTLQLDANVQRVAVAALGDRRGAVVAIDPRNGGIIALVSNPGFDSNLFVHGISSADYRALRESPDIPLFNRAVQGQYPPGSTMKPLLALAGLHYEMTTAESTVSDPGYYQLKGVKHKYRDWKRHGNVVNLMTSIEQSCDVYYYDLSHRLGIDRIYDFASQFGLGSKTNVDITAERSGLLPSREWKRRVYNLPWYPGETLILGIGQGYMLATPLQLAQMTATIAARGQRFQPRLIKSVNGEPMPSIEMPGVEVAPAHWDLVHAAMREVVHGARGTGKRVLPGITYEMAGKTGTAQVIGIKQGEKYDASKIAERHRDHGLFISFAPVDDPVIAVAVLLENGEHGSWAAPIARQVTDVFLGVAAQ